MTVPYRKVQQLLLHQAKPMNIANTCCRQVLNGRNMTDSEVSGMLIALLMAGQHTSSTVSSWLMCFIW